MRVSLTFLFWLNTTVLGVAQESSPAALANDKLSEVSNGFDGKLVVSILALVASITAMLLSWRTATKLKKRDIQIDKRKLFITALWDKLTAVQGLNPTNVDQQRLLAVLNTLELVALCWDAEIVDKDLVVTAFGSSYNERIDEIKRIVIGSDYDKAKISELGGEGPVYLRMYPRVEKVGREIRDHRPKGIDQ